MHMHTAHVGACGCVNLASMCVRAGRVCGGGHMHMRKCLRMGTWVVCGCSITRTHAPAVSKGTNMVRESCVDAAQSQAGRVRYLGGRPGSRGQGSGFRSLCFCVWGGGGGHTWEQGPGLWGEETCG